MATPSVDALLQGLAAAGKAHAASEAGSREKMLELAHALIGELEIPSEFLQRSFWTEPAKSALIRMAVDLEIFQHLRDAGEAGLATEALAARTGSGADPGLLRRVMAHLAATHVVGVRGGGRGGEGRWVATPLSDSLAEPRYQSSIEFNFDTTRPAFNSFPSYFASNGYQPPRSDSEGPFGAAHATTLPFFPWLEANPPNLANFANFMQAYRAGKPDWFAFYPVAERLFDGFSLPSSSSPSSSSPDGSSGSDNDVLLVDVGGGAGHDLRAFAAAHPAHPGRLVLEDLPSVVGPYINTTTTTTTAAEEQHQQLPFTAQAHDFFRPQPPHLASARAYVLHSILHDWSDADAERILRALASSPGLEQQRRGYSRVLLVEIVVADEGRPSVAATNMDMMMLAHLSAGERTEAAWRALAGRAGFEVVGVWGAPGAAESVVELALA